MRIKKWTHDIDSLNDLYKYRSNLIEVKNTWIENDFPGSGRGRNSCNTKERGVAMSKELNKEDVIQHKKRSIRSLNGLLESLINSGKNEHLKKADLLSYWLESFSRYIKYEDTFSPQKLLSYKRGDIIRINLGFRVGAELGGLHYAVVLDKNNKHNSNTVTIVPLSSLKKHPEEIHERDLFLGSELYNLVSAKYEHQLSKIKEKMDETNFIIGLFESLPEENRSSKINEALELLQAQRNDLSDDLNALKKDERGIN